MTENEKKELKEKWKKTRREPTSYEQRMKAIRDQNKGKKKAKSTHLTEDISSLLEILPPTESDENSTLDLTEIEASEVMEAINTEYILNTTVQLQETEYCRVGLDNQAILYNIPSMQQKEGSL